MMRSVFGRRLSAAALYLLLSLPAIGAAQEAPAPSQPASKQEAQSGKRQTIGGEVAQESREAAGEDDKFKNSPSVKFMARVTNLSMEHAYWLGVGVNFAVIAALVFWFAKKTLPAAFRNRTVSIQKAMEEARQASEDANKRLAVIESRLSRLDSEIADLHAAADKEAAEEEDRIRLAAQEDANKIRESAELEIAAAAKAARRELTAYVADLAVGLAAKQLHVDPATDRVLVRNFAQGLSASATPKATKKDGQ